jgi:cation transport ATPase
MTQHPARVAHHVRGRIRVQFPRAKGNRRFLQQVQEFLSPMDGVNRVEINPITGSVIVHYDHSHTDIHQKLAKHAEDAGMFSLAPPELSEVDVLAANIEREAAFLSEHSELARHTVDLVKQINNEVKCATDNTVDLKVLLPFGLALYAFIELGSADISTPLWVTLGMFSFNSFVSLHQPVAAPLEVESAQVIRSRSLPSEPGETSTVRKTTRKKRS